MSTDVEHHKYLHDLKGAVRTLNLFVDYAREQMPKVDQEYQLIEKEVLASLAILEQHVRFFSAADQN